MIDGPVPTREAFGRADELEAQRIPAPQVVEAVRRTAPDAEVPLTVAEAAETLRLMIRTTAASPSLPAEVTTGQATATAIVASLRDVGHGYRRIVVSLGQ